MRQHKILVVSPGIEDGGMRGLGRVTFALIDGLAANGQQVYLLTSAPLKRSARASRSATHNATVRRSLDHYLTEGIRSAAFDLRRKPLINIMFREFVRTFLLRRANIIPQTHQIPTQHQPAALRHFANLTGFINVALFYKLSHKLPRRLAAALIYLVAKRCGIEVIITASPYPLPKPWLVRQHIKMIQYVHDVMPLNIIETPPNSATRFAEELTIAMRGADQVITSSVNARDKLQAILPSLNPRIVYLPCPAAKVTPTTHKISVLTKSNVTKHKYILFMSALEKRKNVARLIEAFEMIAPKTTYKLVIVGSKGYGWEEIEQALQGLSPKVQKRIILTGYVSEEDKWSLLANCGLVVHPAIDEGLGIPVIEALMAKKPVVSTRLTSIEEFSPVGCITYIEDPYNVYEIADKLLVAIDAKPQLVAPLKKGAAIIAEVFSEQAFALRLESVLRAVLGPNCS